MRWTSACSRAIGAPFSQSEATRAMTVLRPTAETLPSSIACTPSRWHNAAATACVSTVSLACPISCSPLRTRSSETMSRYGD